MQCTASIAEFLSGEAGIEKRHRKFIRLNDLTFSWLSIDSRLAGH